MRILGFNKRWPKLTLEVFTTFRFARKGRDWEVGEKVQCVLHPRSKQQEVLFTAEIMAREPRWMYAWPPNDGVPVVSNEEAANDGFPEVHDGWGARMQMWGWLYDHYPLGRLFGEPMNKLTLKKVKP